MKNLSNIQIVIMAAAAIFCAACCYQQGFLNMVVGAAMGAGIALYFINRYNHRKNMTQEQLIEEAKAKAELKQSKLEAKMQKEKVKATIAGYKHAAKVASIKPLTCPRCGSDDVKALEADKKFSWGKAAGGTLLSGSIGSLAGFTGKNSGKTVFVCMNCGKQFKQ